MKKTFFLAAIIFILTGCEDTNKKLSKNYITEYLYNSKSINATFVYTESGYERIGDFYLLLVVEGDVTKQGETMFNGYAQTLNDLTFNKPVEETFSTACLSETFNNIDIITNQDYNDNYPAGESIAGIINISYIDPASVIASGYDLTKETPVSANLSRFNEASPHTFTSQTFALYFTEAPKQDGDYTFTIHFFTPEGKTLDTSISNVKIKGGN